MGGGRGDGGRATAVAGCACSSGAAGILPDACLQKLIPETNEPDTERFGNATSTQGNTIFIGAYGDERWRGAVHVYERSSPDPASDIWKMTDLLTAPDGEAGDLFGCAVAIDGNLALIGARLDDTSNGVDAGSVLVFERQSADEAWAFSTVLSAEDGSSGDWFGASVALSGTTAIVGASHDDDEQGSGSHQAPCASAGSSQGGVIIRASFSPLAPSFVHISLFSH